MRVNVPTLEALAEEAKRCVGALAKNTEGATLVTLSGELGAGKTAFTKALAVALGVAEIVNSPTFVLEKIYALPPGPAFSKLAHIDAYRLKSGSELAALGFDELMHDAGTLVVLEWPEQVADALPTPSARITITPLPDGSRDISYG